MSLATDTRCATAEAEFRCSMQTPIRRFRRVNVAQNRREFSARFVLSANERVFVYCSACRTWLTDAERGAVKIESFDGCHAMNAARHNTALGLAVECSVSGLYVISTVLCHAPRREE